MCADVVRNLWPKIEVAREGISFRQPPLKKSPAHTAEYPYLVPSANEADIRPFVARCRRSGYKALAGYFPEELYALDRIGSYPRVVGSVAPRHAVQAHRELANRVCLSFC